MPKSSHVLIVGNGIAGLAAARYLQGGGLHVRVVAARDRCGGRTHSSNALGPALDLDWVPTDYRRFAVYTAQGTPEPPASGAIENFEGELERLNRKAKGTESVADRLGLNVEGRVQ